ncbi:hypothetical protein AAG906_004387 [Vitis piasezkii]
MSRDNRHASSWLVGESMRQTYQVGRQYRPKDIIGDIRNKYSVQNPGTITNIVTNVDNQFKYLFMAFGACIFRFRASIRPVIAVDGTFLKSKYLGTFFMVYSNNQIYPLAFGIGDSENDASWEWFLTKLYNVIGHVDDLVVVSDRHGSIEKTVQKLYPHASHGLCTYHLGQNLKTKFKKVVVHKLFHDVAHAYRMSDFDTIFGQLEMISPTAAKYLVDVGVNRWARSHSNGKRYNIMTTGIIECMNVVLKDARDLPIVRMVEELRNLLQIWFSNRQQQALSMKFELATWADMELHLRFNKSSGYEVEPINSWEFNVKYTGVNNQVNLQTRSCTCRVFDLDHIPCAHAIAACRYGNMSCYTLCSQYYMKNSLISSYSKSIYPTRNNKDWVIPEDIHCRVVLPPKSRRPAGRPRKERIRSGGETKHTRCCGRCGDYGHNRKTCKRPIPLHPRDEHSCVNIVESNINIQELSLQPVHQSL